jgi:hypothetical protein
MTNREQTVHKTLIELTGKVRTQPLSDLRDAVLEMGPSGFLETLQGDPERKGAQKVLEWILPYLKG